MLSNLIPLIITISLHVATMGRVRHKCFKGKRLDAIPKIFQVSEMSVTEHLYVTFASPVMWCYRKSQHSMDELLEAERQPLSIPESCLIHVGIIIREKY